MMIKFKIFEAFAGVGSQLMSLRNLGIIFESVGISEIDKYANKSYELIHGKTNNYGDITKIDWSQVPDFDLFTYSFPCQDISSAGKQRGFKKDSQTRSSLLWECERCIQEKRPEYLLLENVEAIIHEKNRPHFFEWLNVLYKLGYANYWQVLNAKDYGIPQNRERMFVVSIRKDINAKRATVENSLFEKLTFEFPKPFDNKLRLRHFLESEVDEKYFLSEKMLKCLIGRGKIAKGYEFKIKDKNYYANCIIKKAGNYSTDNYISEMTIRTQEPNGIILNNRIRRLTPLECWRLMGFSETDFNKVRPHLSDTQLYKQAGNSIVVSMLEFIFYELFKNDFEIKRNPYNYYQNEFKGYI